MRAALYHRVSTRDQDPELARVELRRFCNARELRVVLSEEETGSGTRRDRPGLQRILDAARRRAIDVVVIWKVDRIGRSVLDGQAIVEELAVAGVRLVVVTQGIDTGARDPNSRLFLTMLQAFAEWEREVISERTRLGLAGARRRGVQLGRPRSASGPDPLRVAELRLAGMSWGQIAGELGCERWAAQRAARRNECD